VALSIQMIGETSRLAQCCRNLPGVAVALTAGFTGVGKRGRTLRLKEEGNSRGLPDCPHVPNQILRSRRRRQRHGRNGGTVLEVQQLQSRETSLGRADSDIGMQESPTGRGVTEEYVTGWQKCCF